MVTQQRHTGVPAHSRLDTGFSIVTDGSAPRSPTKPARRTRQPWSTASCTSTNQPANPAIPIGAGRRPSPSSRGHRHRLHRPGGGAVRISGLPLRVLPVLRERASRNKFGRSNSRSQRIIRSAHRLTKYLTSFWVAERRLSRVSSDSWLVFVLRALLCPLFFSWLLSGGRLWWS